MAAEEEFSIEDIKILDEILLEFKQHFRRMEQLMERNKLSVKETTEQSYTNFAARGEKNSEIFAQLEKEEEAIAEDDKSEAFSFDGGAIQIGKNGVGYKRVHAHGEDDPKIVYSSIYNSVIEATCENPESLIVKRIGQELIPPQIRKEIEESFKDDENQLQTVAAVQRELNSGIIFVETLETPFLSSKFKKAIGNSGYTDFVDFCSLFLGVGSLIDDSVVLIWDPGGQNCWLLIVLGWFFITMRAKFNRSMSVVKVFDKMPTPDFDIKWVVCMLVQEIVSWIILISGYFVADIEHCEWLPDDLKVNVQQLCRKAMHYGECHIH